MRRGVSYLYVWLAKATAKTRSTCAFASVDYEEQ